MINKVVILAAGLGTRLLPITKEILPILKLALGKIGQETSRNGSVTTARDIL